MSERRSFQGFAEDEDVVALIGKSNVVFVSTPAGGNYFDPSTWFALCFVLCWCTHEDSLVFGL